MTQPKNQKTARIDLDISAESQRLFTTIHKSLGFKTRAETFEAIVFSVSAEDLIHPNVLNRLESKLDQTLEAIDSLT